MVSDDRMAIALSRVAIPLAHGMLTAWPKVKALSVDPLSLIHI